MNFEPIVLGFLCQQSGDLCADFAGMEQKTYAPNFLPIKLPCLGGLDTIYLLKAYFLGSDGVLVLGCPEGHCKHKKGNEIAQRRVQAFQSLLEVLGIGKDRLDLALIHSSEISRLIKMIDGFIERVAKLGPSPLIQSNLTSKKREASEGLYWLEQFKKCDHCYQCKEVCPICFCKRCYIGSLPNFAIAWLAHVMERCTGCGRCEDACPQGIRLFDIIQLLRQKFLTLGPLFSQKEGKKEEKIIQI